MGPILKLVPKKKESNPDIVDALERLLALAKGPGLDGLAFVALEHGTGYSADVLGCIHEHPLFTLTLCRELEEAVRAQTRKKT